MDAAAKNLCFGISAGVHYCMGEVLSSLKKTKRMHDSDKLEDVLATFGALANMEEAEIINTVLKDLARIKKEHNARSQNRD